MNPRNEKVLKAWLSQKSEDERRALERFLPDEERLFLAELPAFDKDSVADEIDATIHWSWYLPILSDLPSDLQKLYLSSLSTYDATRLSQSLNIEKPTGKISNIAAEYLHKQLLKKLKGEEIIPPDYLPSSPLKELLWLTKKELLKLIDCLGLYDFAFEFRQILDTKNLKKIYSFLSEQQREILAKISPPKEIKPLPELGLARWSGNAEDLLILLHRRGLAKLGIALSGEDPDLRWTLAHQLDSGRGATVMKHPGQIEDSQSETAREQIVELLGLI